MIRKPEILLVLFLVPIILGLSCTDSIDAQNDEPVHQPVTGSSEDGENMSELYAGNRNFAFDLYAKLREEAGFSGSENIVFSPYSISLALAMTWAGARGETEAEMAQTLHFTLPQDALHPAFNTLSKTLEERSGETDEGSILLALANSLWGQEGWDFLAEFHETMEQNYGAGIREVDFAGDPDACRVEINDWVGEETREKIVNLIPGGAIDTLTTLVLVNAVYFNGNWLWRFDESDTADGEFHLLDGETVEIPMMHQNGEFRFASLDDCQAVELPYVGDKLSMVFIMPHEGRFDEFEETFSSDRVDEIIGSLTPVQINLAIPRFELEVPYEQMATTLSEMGMPSAFGAADFSGMDGSRELFISAVIHKAFLSVSEEGTEAAASTAVIMARGLPPSFTANRPFIFMIRDNETDTILFMGRLLNPGGVQ